MITLLVKRIPQKRRENITSKQSLKISMVTVASCLLKYKTHLTTVTLRHILKYDNRLKGYDCTPVQKLHRNAVLLWKRRRKLNHCNVTTRNCHFQPTSINWCCYQILLVLTLFWTDQNAQSNTYQTHLFLNSQNATSVSLNGWRKSGKPSEVSNNSQLEMRNKQKSCKRNNTE